MDFIVVLTSTIEMIYGLIVTDDLPSFKILRLLRVLRPLRTFKRVPRMRRMVSIILKSLPELVNTMMFLGFFFVVFGILSINSFQGTLYQRCSLIEKPDGTIPLDITQKNFICLKNDDKYNGTSFFSTRD